jgi:glycosyltransferase involved in cell wall biosynthesis
MPSKEVSVSANVLIRNEIRHLDHLIHNLLDAKVDELVILDGGSTDGSWERLQEWAKQEPRILALQWPQPAGSEYRQGFKEVARRNLMIQASSSEYILYIDADERISLGFKSAIDANTDCIAVSRVHFWKGWVRENGFGDKVWSPDSSFRIFRRNKNIYYKSNDKNGLHNYLTYRGIKIPLGATRNQLVRVIARTVRILLRIRAIESKDPPKIFHYHYFDLSREKVNDLRSAEFEWHVIVDSSPDLPKQPGAIYVTSLKKYQEAEEITEKYWIRTAKPC